MRHTELKISCVALQRVNDFLCARVMWDSDSGHFESYIWVLHFVGHGLKRLVCRYPASLNYAEAGDVTASAAPDWQELSSEGFWNVTASGRVESALLRALHSSLYYALCSLFQVSVFAESMTCSATGTSHNNFSLLWVSVQSGQYVQGCTFWSYLKLLKGRCSLQCNLHLMHFS